MGLPGSLAYENNSPEGNQQMISQGSRHGCGFRATEREEEMRGREGLQQICSHDWVVPVSSPLNPGTKGRSAKERKMQQNLLSSLV